MMNVNIFIALVCTLIVCHVEAYNGQPRRDADYMASNIKRSLQRVLPIFIIPAVAKAGLFASDEQNGRSYIETAVMHSPS